MKKQSIILGSLLMIASGLYGASMNDILGHISSSGVMCTTDTLSGLSAAEQNKNLSELAKATDMAKEFAINNSKNLIGSKDSDIAKAVAAMEKASMDFINSVKIIRGVSSTNDLTNQANQLATIKNSLVMASNKLASTTMTLGNKKDAKRVIMTLCNMLEDLVEYAHKDVLKKISAKGGSVSVA